MLLFHWLEQQKNLHEELPANTGQPRHEPPLLYNSLLEPLVASNCKGKINQNVKLLTSYNTKIFKISPGFSSKLKPHNSLNLALCRACLYDHFFACQLYFKTPGENQHIDLFDHFYEAILCYSHYVFIALARGVSMPDFGFSEATSKWPNMSFFRIAETI